jgi:peptidoglycan/xylan/chitin deacetylase (PgdA/CDA1 family)
VTYITPTLLDELDEHNIPATFYMTADSWENPSQAKCDMVGHIINDRRMNHTAQCHSYSHPNHDGYTREQVGMELDRAVEWMRSCGANPTHYRPPYGVLSEDNAEYLTSRGFEVAMWNLDSRDFDEGSTIDTVYNNVVQGFENDIKEPNSAVILMHDANHHDGIIARFATYFRAMGYEFITAEECVSYCTYARCRGASGPSPYAGTFVP